MSEKTKEILKRLKKSKNLTSNEFLDLLDAFDDADDALEEKNTGEYRVYLQPPVDQKGDTDCDDDEDEEDENVQPVNPDILPRRILLAPAEVGVRATKTPQIIGMRGINEDDEDDPSPGSGGHRKENEEDRSDDEMEDKNFEDPTVQHPRRRRGPKGGRRTTTAPAGRGAHASRRVRGGQARRGQAAKAASQSDPDGWSEKDEGKVGTEIPEFKFDENNSFWQHLKSFNIDSPLQFYKEMMPDDFMEQVVEQSRLYAEQHKNKSWSKWQTEVTVDNLRVVEGIMLLSGYNNLPSRRLYWEQRDDVYNKMVAENISKSKFEGILSCLHYADNGQANNDRYYKVRPIFKNLNKQASKYTSLINSLSVDESMIPYFGRHNTKQYIRGKPIRYGFKVWVICSADGMGLYFEPYCGADTDISDIGLGQGPNVVMSLVEKAGVQRGSELYFDNLFTSFPLLQKLSSLGIGGTGTVRKNKLHRVPLPEAKTVEKMERGISRSVYKSDMVCTVWRDNKAVYAASNIHNVTKKDGGDMSNQGQAKRYSKEAGGHVFISRPDMIAKYNEGMGGVDLLDGMVALDRCTIKKKWWFAFVPWSINVAAVNAWRLRNMALKGHGIAFNKHEHNYLSFVRDLVEGLVKCHGKHSLTLPMQMSVSAPQSKKLKMFRKPVTDVRYDNVGHCIKKHNEGHRGRCKKCTEDKRPGDNRSTYYCPKCNVSIHVDCFWEFHNK